MFNKVVSIGKKISGGIHSAMRMGKKVVGKIQSISSKVKSKTKYLKPFIPEKHMDKFNKAESVLGRAHEVSKTVGSGIEKAEKHSSSIQEAIKSRSLSGGHKAIKNAYYDVKNAKNYTQGQLKQGLIRPTQNDNTSLHKELTASTDSSIRKAQRKLVSGGIDSASRGIKRQVDSKLSGDADIQKAIAMAKTAQKAISQKPNKKGILRRR